MTPSPVPEVEPVELAAELRGPNAPMLLDVREDEEREISVLEGDVHIPMAELLDRLDELDRTANMVVYCRTGNRSARVTAYLLARGFTNVRNLAGGINEWARLVDPSLRTY